MIRKVGLGVRSGCCRVSRCLVDGLRALERRLKGNSSMIVQTCVENCEYVLAHRIHRNQHGPPRLYSRLWGRGLATRGALFFAVFASSYNWDTERISDQDILRFSAEMNIVESLMEKKDSCLKGKCPAAECMCSVCTGIGSEWQSFIEKDDIRVWKREDVNHRGQGLYCYKMYTTYEDVTAFDFLEAQIDLEYRLSWDNHVVKVELLESEPSTNSDVIYWETKWPSFFCNRDHVFKRRYRIDKKRNLIFLVNQITTHPSKPPVSSKHRISEYWSYMVIKPRTTFDKPGFEFSFTYFENPGIIVPSPVMSWVATSAMPDMLKRSRLAALGMTKKRGGDPSFLAGKDGTTNMLRARNYLALDRLRQTMFLF